MPEYISTQEGVTRPFSEVNCPGALRMHLHKFFEAIQTVVPTTGSHLRMAKMAKLVF